MNYPDATGVGAGLRNDMVWGEAGVADRQQGADDQRDAGTPVYPTEMAYVFHMQNASGGVNAKCLAAMGDPAQSWRCMFGPETYAFVDSPIFPFQSVLDSWQMSNIYPRVWSSCTTNNFNACNSTEVRGMAGRGWSG
jgi:hypothetical protein